MLAQNCDLCIAADTATFAITEVKVGRGAQWAAPLPWLIPPRIAMEILLTGRPITGHRAYELGMVNQVVPSTELALAPQQLGECIAANAPLSVAAAKQTVHLITERPLTDAFAEAELGPGIPQRRCPRGPAGIPRKTRTRLEGPLMAVNIQQLLADVRAETAVVDTMLADLDPADWERPTGAAGWAIRDQLSHLAFFDDAATHAAKDPDAFRESAKELLALGDDFPDQVADRLRAMPVGELRDWFRSARAQFVTVFATIDPGLKLPWYGPDMSAASSITARLMETWAHGRDIADTLGHESEPTERLRQHRSPRRAHLRLRGQADPYVGMRLPVLLKQAGLHDVLCLIARPRFRR